MTLSTLAILIGAVYSAIQIFALLRPAEFTKKARAFPRSEGIGFVLMGLGTAWFLYNLQAEAIADFAAYKKYMLIAFGATIYPALQAARLLPVDAIRGE